MDLPSLTNKLVNIKSTLGWTLMNEGHSKVREDKLWDIVDRIDKAVEVSHGYEKEQAAEKEQLLNQLLAINTYAIDADYCVAEPMSRESIEDLRESLRSLFGALDAAILGLVGNDEHLNSILAKKHVRVTTA